MPIRHCQKCGLKVLIDESQAQTSVFYCQRCTTAMKTQEAAAMEAAVAVRPQTPIPSSPTASPKPVTVKVLCPYCKASFNGRVPQKPARGACPVCQKELILLPNGDIRPAAGFDLARWQQEQREGAPAAAEKPESGTKVLINKYSADAAPAKKSDGGTRLGVRKAAPAPEPPAAMDPSDGGPGDEAPAALPEWLDDAANQAAASKRPTPSVDMPLEPEPEPEPEPEAEPSTVQLDDLPQAGPPVEDELPATSDENYGSSVHLNPDPEPDPEPPPAPPPAAIFPPPAPPPPPKGATAGPRKGTGVVAVSPRKTDRRLAASAAIPGAKPTGAGKVMVAYLLLILPLVAGPVLFDSREKLKGTPVEKLGVHFQKGFYELYLRLLPPAAAPKAPVEEKKVEAPPEEKPKPGPEEQAQMEKQIVDLYMKYMREKRTYDQKMKGATEAEKKEFEPVAERLKRDEDRVRALREDYKKWFGKDYNPADQ